MSCQPMDRILQTLKTRIPGATDALLQVELFNVLDRFFRRTNVWRWLSETTLERDITRYDLFPPSDSELVRVMWAMYGDNPVPQTYGPYTGSVSHGLIDQDSSSTGALTGNLYDADRIAQPKPTGAFKYAVYFPTYVQVTFPPDDNPKDKYPLAIQMALTLKHSCLECDAGDWSLEDWMYDRYANDWIDGVQASMFSMIAKPWSNPVMAKFHGQMFTKAMSQAKVEGEKGIVFNTQNWRFPRGGFVT